MFFREVRNGEPGKTFTTLDAYLSGYLVLKGFKPELVQQGDKVVFVFEATSDFYKAIEAYNAGAPVDASKLALTVKTLKSKIYALRKGK